MSALFSFLDSRQYKPLFSDSALRDAIACIGDYILRHNRDDSLAIAVGILFAPFSSASRIARGVNKSTIYFDKSFSVWNSANMNTKGSVKRRKVIAISETLHYRLRQTALRKRIYLEKLVEGFLWDALKADLK